MIHSVFHYLFARTENKIGLDLQLGREVNKRTHNYGVPVIKYPYKTPYIISSLMMFLKKNELLTITSLIVLAAAITPLIISTNFEGRSVIMQISYAQQNVMNQTSAGFRSVFDTFVIPGSSHGYGVYEEHKSNVFKPGEKIALYIEPVGFTHRPITGTTNKSETLYLSNFTADVVISDKAGKVLGGVQNLPVSEILSHHKNIEISLTVSLTQSNPFPVGDYMVKYLIRDVPSGNTFQIVKNIKVGNA